MEIDGNFNVSLAHRQPGSAFKPFVYAAALDNGATQLDVVADAPIAVATASGVWAPGNYDNKYLGPVTLRTALARSLNTVSVRLVLAALVLAAGMSYVLVAGDLRWTQAVALAILAYLVLSATRSVYRVLHAYRRAWVWVNPER